MTALPIQKNLDGSYPKLKLKEIFAHEPKCRSLFSECVAIGLSRPLEDNGKVFAQKIKPRLEKLVGWNAEKDVLSASGTYDTFHRACLEAIDCWMFYRRFKNKRRAWGAFKSKFGRPPLFENIGPWGE